MMPRPLSNPCGNYFVKVPGPGPKVFPPNTLDLWQFPWPASMGPFEARMELCGVMMFQVVESWHGLPLPSESCSKHTLVWAISSSYSRMSPVDLILQYMFWPTLTWHSLIMPYPNLSSYITTNYFLLILMLKWDPTSQFWEWTVTG